MDTPGRSKYLVESGRRRCEVAARQGIEADCAGRTHPPGAGKEWHRRETQNRGENRFAQVRRTLWLTVEEWLDCLGAVEIDGRLIPWLPSGGKMAAMYT